MSESNGNYKRRNFTYFTHYIQRRSSQVLHEVESPNWLNCDNFLVSSRQNFSVADYQKLLRDDMHKRTQGQTEPIASYLINIRLIISQIQPPMPLAEQLDVAHRNANKYFLDRVHRSQLDNFNDFLNIGKELTQNRIRN